MKRSGLLALFALVIGLARPETAAAHTRLLHSSPAADSTVTVPTELRLAFSGPVDAATARITITGADGVVHTLTAVSDPRNINGVVASLRALRNGVQRVEWRIVSADGHPVSGSFSFTVTGGADVSDAPAPIDPGTATTADTTNGSQQPDANVSDTGAGLGRVMVRAIATLLLFALAGLLSFRAAFAAEAASTVLSRAQLWLAFATVVALAAQVLSWASYAAGGFDLTIMRAVMRTATGYAESARLVLAVLTLWAFGLARRARWAAAFALLAVTVSAFIGHAAAVQPALLVPLKAVHLLGAAFWLGALLHLLTAGGTSSVNRVSAVALVSVITILVTGLAQAFLVTSPTALFGSPYGWLLVAKAAALALLVSFGALNRVRYVPAQDRADAIRSLRRVVRLEIVVMVLTFAIAAALAYTPPPPRDGAALITLPGGTS